MVNAAPGERVHGGNPEYGRQVRLQMTELVAVNPPAEHTGPEGEGSHEEPYTKVTRRHGDKEVLVDEGDVFSFENDDEDDAVANDNCHGQKQDDEALPRKVHLQTIGAKVSPPIHAALDATKGVTWAIIEGHEGVFSRSPSRAGVSYFGSLVTANPYSPTSKSSSMSSSSTRLAHLIDTLSPDSAIS